MASLANKVIAITGASSGIGRVAAKILASRGALLSLSDVNQEGLDETLKLIKQNGDKKHISRVVDVRSGAQVDSWIEDTVKHFGRLDGGVNLAGVTTDGVPIAEETDANWDFLMDINARGVFNCMRAELKHMNDGGAVVNAASVAGIVGGPTWAIYAASKHAVIGLTQSAAREVGARGIRVNSVAPGTIDTPMTQGMEQRLGVKTPTSSQALDRKADPSEVANVVAFLVSDEATFVTGATWNVDGGHLC